MYSENQDLDFDNLEGDELYAKLKEFLDGVSNPEELDGNGITKAWHRLTKKDQKKDIRESVNRIKGRSTREPYETDSKVKIFFEDYKFVNPSLDFTESEMMIISPFRYERPIFNKNNEYVGSKEDWGNFVVLSSRRVFQCNEAEFSNRNLIAKIPDSVLDQRWSSESAEGFLRDGLDADPFETFKEIKEAYDYFLDFGSNKGAVTANALYSMLTYCYPLFQSVPYLKFTGNKGSAKSKGGDIHNEIDFNSLKSVSMSPASMFRTIQDTRGTLEIDEAETYGKNQTKSESQEALNQVINSGFQAQGKVPRIEGQSRKRINYSTYGPKVICGISSVTETLRDRSYEFWMVKTLDKTRARRSVNGRDPRWQRIRDMLYLTVLNHWKEIREISESGDVENRLDLAGRDWDKAFPLLTLAQFVYKYAGNEAEKIVNETWEFLNDQKEKDQELQLETLDSEIINELEAMVKRSLPEVNEETLNDALAEIKLRDFALIIAEIEGESERRNFKLPTYSRKIKSILKRLGLADKFRSGHANQTLFSSNLKMIMDARERYKVAGSEEKSNSDLNHLNPFNYPNHPNHLNPENRVKINLLNPNLNPSDNLENSQEVKKVKMVKQHEEGDETPCSKVKDLLIDSTYNSTKKYRSVKELFDLASDPGVTHSFIYGCLEEGVAEGELNKINGKYAFKEFLIGDV